MRFLGIFIFVLLILDRGIAQTPEVLHTFWQQKEMKHAAIGVSVKNVADGKVVYEYNAGMSLRPASVLKLLSTSLALKLKGDSLTFHTKVFYSGKIRDGLLQGNIVIEPGGDPCLDSKYFKGNFLSRLVDSIVRLGIKQIEGNIIIENEGQQPLVPGSWLWEDVANYYAALYHPFNYRDNTYTINLASGKPGTPTRVVSVIPSVPGVKLRNGVVSSVKQQDDAWIYGGPEASTLSIRGTIPANRSSFAVKGAMHHPASVFRAELEKELKNKGVVLKKKKDILTDRQEFFTVESPLLKEIVFYTNKNSVNLFAEALGALVSPSEFETMVKEELNHVGIDSSGITIKDACGLSTSNALPAEMVADLLVWANKHLGDSFLASLPRGGVDRGLRVYSADPVLGANLRAKTGSMFGVRALSGYLHTRKGETLAFTIFVNSYTGDPVKVQEAIRDFLRELAIQ